MANVQLQRTQHAETFTETAIDQKQSVDVVQTMLHGALSSIFYLRDLIPDKAFDQEVYEISGTILPYEDYARGELDAKLKTDGGPRLVMQVLRRNRSRRADLLLDLLESGVLSALKASILQAVQVYIHESSNDREKVIETYTFTINYLRKTDGGFLPAGIAMDGPGSELVSVRDTNQAFQLLFRQINKLCESLPDLPATRFVSMELFYTPDTKKLPTAKGWVPSTNEKLIFAEAEGWEKRTQHLEDMRSGFHSTSVKVSHLEQISRLNHGDVPEPEPPRIPRKLQFNLAYSKEEDVTIPQSINEVVDTNHTPSTVVDSTVEKPSAPSGRNQSGRALTTPAPTSDNPAPAAVMQHTVVDNHTQDSSYLFDPNLSRAFRAPSRIDTQSSNNLEMTRALNSMMQPEYLTQGDTQIRTVSNPRAAESESTESPNRNSVSPSRSNVEASRIQESKPVLLNVVGKRLSNRRSQLRLRARELAKTRSNQKANAELVLCQCNRSDSQEHMLQCVYCNTLQHSHCYGYTGRNDPRLPADHVCYQCLLGDDEKKTLADLVPLLQKRRAMHFVLEKGLKTQGDLATNLGLEMYKTGPIYQHLKKEGYVIPAKGSHKSGYASSGKAQFVCVRNGPDHAKLLDNLFDPMKLIGHHYELPSRSEAQTATLTKQLLEAEKRGMPPPATPASHSKRSIAQTSGSDLDLRSSVTPFETPIRPRNHQMKTSKRGRLMNDDEDDPTPPKRHLTSAFGTNPLLSAQTELMLDARPQSSSPADTFSKD